MWIIAKHGFISLVEHKDDPDKIRVRARRREHLAGFVSRETEIIDLGVDAPDYRWHADVPRRDMAEELAEAVHQIDYASHVKESVTGDDRVFYRAMLDCWHALFKLQADPKPEHDWWSSNRWAPPVVAPTLDPGAPPCRVVACPTCSAKPGERCITLSGENPGTPTNDHDRRHIAWYDHRAADEDDPPFPAFLDDEVFDAIQHVVPNLDPETIAAIRDAVLEVV